MIKTKKIEFFVKDSEYDELQRIKGTDTWRVGILRNLGVDVEEIPVGRPKHELDTLFEWGPDRDELVTKGATTHEVRPAEPSETAENPEKKDEMGELFEPWKKEEAKK